MPASTIVMISPLTFCANTETMESNSFQKDSTSLSKFEVTLCAQEEHKEFRRVLKAHGIQIKEFEEVPGAETPDCLFPNNWFCHLPDQGVFVFPMQAINRRREVRQDIINDLGSKKFFDLTSWADKGLFLEGTGSLILDHVHKLAYACLAPRTSEELLAKFEELSGYKAIAFHSYDKNRKEIYHTNVMMALGDKNVVINLASITDQQEKEKLLSLFRQTNKNVIDITHEQMENFAGNMLFLSNSSGQTFWACSTRAYNALTPEQKSQLETEGKIIHSPLNTIEDYGGGGARCLMAEVF